MGRCPTSTGLWTSSYSPARNRGKVVLLLNQSICLRFQNPWLRLPDFTQVKSERFNLAKKIGILPFQKSSMQFLNTSVWMSYLNLTWLFTQWFSFIHPDYHSRENIRVKQVKSPIHGLFPEKKKKILECGSEPRKNQRKNHQLPCVGWLGGTAYGELQGFSENQGWLCRSRSLGAEDHADISSARWMRELMLLHLVGAGAEIRACLLWSPQRCSLSRIPMTW